MKGKKTYRTTILIALSVGILTQSMTVFAASISDNTVPEFANSAEAIQAANQAREVVTTTSNLKESLANVENAQISVNKAMKSGDQNAITKASIALEKVEEAYMRELADISGVIETDILSMRDSGMEWRQVGHELGMHSEMLGFGHRGEMANHKDMMSAGPNQIGGVDALELSEATAINSNNGWSEGHGVNIRSGIHDSGSGFMGINKWNGNDSGGISGAGGIRHGSVSGNNWGNRNGNNSMNNDDNRNDNHNNNSNNNMNDNHNSDNNDNRNDNNTSNNNNNRNDNNNSNTNDNRNDNHNSNNNDNRNDNHNSNDSGGMGGSGGHGGSRR